MNRSLQNVPFILSQATLLAVIAAMAHAQSATPVLVAKFVGTLNTKSAKPGDAVVAMTERPAKTADGKEILKGSLITGEVVAMQSKIAGNGNSTLAIKFDKIEVKGTRLPIEGQIVAIGRRSGPDIPDSSYLGFGNSTPSVLVAPVSSTTDGSGGGHDGLGIVAGSTLPGVTVAPQLNDAGATELNGHKRDIQLDSSVLVKVKLN
jgi:hypothetical protein